MKIIISLRGMIGWLAVTAIRHVKGRGISSILALKPLTPGSDR